MYRVAIAVLATVAAIIVAGEAVAVRQAKSLYTVLDLASCAPIVEKTQLETWRCPGLDGFPVYVARSEGRMYLSVGGRAARGRAATQTLEPPNTIFEGGSHRTTIEWRFVIRDSKPVPYAMIVRYTTGTTQAERGEFLVVTRVSDSTACHVAHIDATAHADAIAIAREAADRRARSFDCTAPPTVIDVEGQ